MTDKCDATAVDDDLPDNPDATAADEEDPQVALAQEAARWKEVALRSAADLENFRKRMAREKEESIRYGTQGLLEELLPILDNFDMGMRAAAQESSSMIFLGMDMVRKQLEDFLMSQGVSEIRTEPGTAFDPNLHDAVAEENAEDIPEGQVLRAVRRGFKLRDRLLRPAGVVVSNGPSQGEPS
jgi:molecular chaperone GrpE